MTTHSSEVLSRVLSVPVQNNNKNILLQESAYVSHQPSSRECGEENTSCSVFCIRHHKYDGWLLVLDWTGARARLHCYVSEFNSGCVTLVRKVTWHSTHKIIHSWKRTTGNGQRRRRQTTGDTWKWNLNVRIIFSQKCVERCCHWREANLHNDVDAVPKPPTMEWKSYKIQ